MHDAYVWNMRTKNLAVIVTHSLTATNMVTIVDNEESPPSSVASGSMTTTSKPSYNVRAPSLWDWIVFTVQAFVHMGPPLFNSLFGLKQKWSPDDMEDQTGQVSGWDVYSQY
jgi:hypothetical protein